MALTFKQAFFRYYDRKIASGEITFSTTGISKAKFTALCTGDEMPFTEEDIADMCIRMKLNDEESRTLTEAAGFEYKAL